VTRAGSIRGTGVFSSGVGHATSAIGGREQWQRRRITGGARRWRGARLRTSALNAGTRQIRTMLLIEVTRVPLPRQTGLRRAAASSRRSRTGTAT
jgi:hypothetical protein